MVKSIALAKKEDGLADEPAWTWLMEVLDTLGPDGMSSDKSEGEADEDHSDEAVLNRTAFTFRVKRMPWRRDITKELEIIDAERLKDRAVYRRQGSKPAQRRRNPDAPLSSREAPAGLPQAFYDESWIAKLSKDKRRDLAVSDRKFYWFNVAPA